MRAADRKMHGDKRQGAAWEMDCRHWGFDESKPSYIFKYFDFLLFNINFIFEKAGIQQIEKPFDIILPVGISFYTFQSLGYMVDVYRGI